MLISIMSDSHDHYENLKKAISISNKKKSNYILFAGDLISPANGLELFSKFNGEVIMVLGNNEGELIGQTIITKKFKNIRLSKSQAGGNIFEEKIDNIRIFMHHYPKISELALKSGEYDLCICGHTHKFKIQKHNESYLLNPGSIHPYKTKASFIIFNTLNKDIEKIEL